MIHVLLDRKEVLLFIDLHHTSLFLNSGKSSINQEIVAYSKRSMEIHEDLSSSQNKHRSSKLSPPILGKGIDKQLERNQE
eukprot:snap_masked-scaffold_1-processed-gene-27.16-mRNA-1 protein AED:1.00 eAED:1.00 QI:0/-1/0/0/-1/1/1/0/79